MNELEFSIPPELAQTVASELDDDEHVVWAAQPKPGRMVLQTIPIILFGIPWTAFSIFWMVGASAATFGANKIGGVPGVMAFAFPLFGCPFVLIGLAMLSSPLWTLRSAKRSVYVITGRRAIIFEGSGWKTTKIRAFSAERLGELRRNQNNDGSGDLIFTQELGPASSGRRPVKDVGFMGVPDVRIAEQHIRDLIAKASDNV